MPRSEFGAKVIHLSSHPRRAAALRREQLRQEAMRRHPAYQSRRSNATAGDGTSAAVHQFRSGNRTG